MMKATNKETDESLIRLAFRFFDKDNSGFISKSEFKTLMTTMGERLSEEECDELVSCRIQAACLST